MSEVLTHTPDTGVSTEIATPAQSVEQAGRFNRLRELGNRAYTLLELATGLSNVNHHISAANEIADGINERYGGLPGRQTYGERVSMQVEDDVRLTFRRDAQRAGYTDIDTMPVDLRTAAAELAARSHRTDIINELQAQHADWTAEQLDAATEALITDLATRFAMDNAEREAYEADLFTYQEKKASIPGLIAERTEFRTEYNARVRNIGYAALQGLVGMASAVRNVPSSLSAKGTIVFMDARGWYANRTGEQKKLVWLSAASVAFAGIASYLAIRYSAGMGHGGDNSQSHMHLAGYNTPEGESIGGPTTHGEAIGSAPIAGEPIGVTHGDSIGQPSANPGESIGAGPTAGEPIGSGQPATGESIGSQPTTGEPIGSAQPTTGESIGSPSATNGEPIGSGSATNGEPIGQGPTTGEAIGVDPSGVEATTGLDLSHARTTKELFDSVGKVDKWPDRIEVSHYNASNHDGSLYGISTEMLERSGVTNPSDIQVRELVDILRPQAQPNGWLNEGQMLDIRPAVDALQHIS